jgi:hypothetical protein
MGRQYGIKTARESLTYLSSPYDINERLIKAFSEIEVIEQDDVSSEHFKKIKV